MNPDKYTILEIVVYGLRCLLAVMGCVVIGLVLALIRVYW